MNSTKFGWADVLNGIPQGTVLDPIMFVIYINNRVESTAKLFTDDTTLYAPRALH